MNIKKLVKPKDLPDFLRSLALLSVLIVAGVVMAGNTQWVQISDHEDADAAINVTIKTASAEQTKALMAVTAAQKQLSHDLTAELARYQINALDAQITFLKIKVQQSEASESEKIILPTLERQLRELKRNIE